MVRNVELLESVMRHVLDHPDKHDQGKWVCGSKACFAGHALLMSGYSRKKIDKLAGQFGSGYRKLVVIAAADELGLTLEEASVLFSIRNTVPDLQLMVKALVNGEVLQAPVRPRPPLPDWGRGEW